MKQMFYSHGVLGWHVPEGLKQSEAASEWPFRAKVFLDALVAPEIAFRLDATLLAQ